MESIQIIKTLDAQRKNPKVNKLIGNSNKLRIGLTRMFNTVKVAPAVRKEFNPPLTLKAGTITVKTYNATAFIKNDFNIFFTCFYFNLSTTSGARSDDSVWQSGGLRRAKPLKSSEMDLILVN